MDDCFYGNVPATVFAACGAVAVGDDACFAVRELYAVAGAGAHQVFGGHHQRKVVHVGAVDNAIGSGYAVECAKLVD